MGVSTEPSGACRRARALSLLPQEPQTLLSNVLPLEMDLLILAESNV